METLTAPRTRDTAVFDLIAQEKQRQTHGLELIASENYVSQQVMDAQGSVLTNKYAEGLARQALLRRLRSGGPGGTTGH